MDLTPPRTPATALPLPPGASVMDVGAGRQPWWFNGQWLSVTVYHAPQNVETLLAWYRQVLAGPWVHRVEQGRHILGRVQGAETWTIQLQTAPGPGGVVGTRGVVAVQRHDVQADSQAAPLAPVTPTGSRVLSHLRTQDGPRASEHLVWSNTDGSTANARWLRTHLGARGFVFDRQSPPGAAVTLWFGGQRREATAVLTQEPSGLSTVVLQVVQFMPIKVPLPEPRKPPAVAASPGQSSVEYLVICAALGTALGVGMVGDGGVLSEWLVALQTAYSRWSFALSLPQ